MKNIIVYDDGCNAFSALNYDILFQRFRQCNEYEHFLEIISDSVFTGEEPNKPYLNAIIQECRAMARKQIKEYEIFQQNNYDEGMQESSSKIMNIIDGTMASSGNSITCFKEFYKKYLKEIYLFDD